MKKLLFTLIAMMLLSIPLNAQWADARIRSGTNLPTVCTVNSKLGLFKKYGTGAGLYECTATNTWTKIGSGGGGSGWTTIFRTTAVQNTSTTLANDSQLQFTAVANKSYMIRLVCAVWVSPSSGLKFTIIKPSHGSGAPVAGRITGYGTSVTALYFENDFAVTNYNTGGYTKSVIELQGVLRVGATGGTIAFQHSQISAGGESYTLYEGSFLEYKEL